MKELNTVVMVDETLSEACSIGRGVRQVRQLSGLAYIPTCRLPITDHRETQIVYNTGRHRPCGGLFLTRHTVRRCPAEFVAPG